MDPFEQFESSPRGWLIPLGLFVLGALATWTAIERVRVTELGELRQSRRDQAVSSEHSVDPRSNDELATEEARTGNE